MNDRGERAVMAAKPRLEQIQFLRFLAFFCVYVAHAEEFLFFPFPASNSSNSAVSFFFVLSGFLAGYNAGTKEIRLDLRCYVGGIWKRIKRIYPLYAITMLIPLVYGPMLHYLSSPGLHGSEIQLVKNLLMIQSWFQEGSMTFNGVGWYISTLMFLNLFTLPAVWFFSRVNRHPKRFFLLCGMIGGILFLTAVYCYLTRHLDISYWQYVFPPARMGEYISGIGLGFLVFAIQEKVRLGKYEKWIFTLLEIGALLFAFKAMYIFGSPWRIKILNWLIPNFILITVFAFGRGWVSGLFRNRWLVRLGDISFECFLIHNLMVIGTTISCEQLSATTAGKAAGFCFNLLFTILISLYLTKSQKPKTK